MKKPLSVFLVAVLAAISNNDALGSTLGLREATLTAEANHPGLVLERSRSDEAKAELKNLPSLSPPSLFVGAMGSNGPLRRNGRMENSIGFSQIFPFPTKLGSELNWRERKSEAAGTKINAVRLKIRLELKKAFFELYAARKKIDYLKEKKDIFEEHSQRLRSTALSDRIFQAHRIWVETELELVGNEMIIAQESERISTGKLNVAMGLDPSLDVPALEEPSLSSAPPESIDLESASPEIQLLNVETKVASASIQLARSMWLPDFTVTYRNARRFDGVMPNYSELTLGVTLPFLFFWQPNAQATAAQARLVGAEAVLNKARNELKMQLLEARTHADSLKRQLNSFHTKIIPQTERRMKIAHGLVPSDMESLREHREAMENVIKMKIEELALRVDYEKTIAEIESITATEGASQVNP